MTVTTAESRRAAYDSDAVLARPPYLLAAGAFVVVLLGYLVSLAPTVTFWDAGEFIATAHILGVPHPPGTPVFVFLGRFWDIMTGPMHTAYATNLMSAMFSAGSAAFFFLFMHEALRKGAEGMDEAGAKIFRIGGAFAATIIAAFTFTVWQNSVETEVYQVAMFSIGAMAWMLFLWRRGRGGVTGAHMMLGIVYVMGVTLGNHLMALLAGPAVFAFIFHVLKTEPARQDAERNVQWAMFAVALTLWIALVGLGVGNTKIVILGSLLYVGAAIWCIRAGSWLFAVAALVAAAAGASTYFMLFIRAGLHPYINEADPQTWDNLWAVMKREQYPPRSPLDNPIYPSGPDNPGRTLQIFGLQILNYIQYFDWQWSSSLDKARTLLAPIRLPFTLLFIMLGMWGAAAHRKWDRSHFWFVCTLFLTTSIGLVLYLNFKPGFSIGYNWFPDREAHEVRERDYFYTVSFVAWGLWAGLGVATVFRALRERLREKPATFAAPVLLIALLPFVLNFKGASRNNPVTRELARDFAYDMLIGVEPYGILFTNGDNDTFPLWYLQEVEGVRQDVVIVNLSLVNTDWYIRQLRDNPARPYQPDSNATRLFGATAGETPACTPAWADTLDAWSRAANRRVPPREPHMPTCLHTMNDAQIAAIQPQLLPNDFTLSVGGIRRTYRAGTPMYVKDIMVLRLIIENMGKRPIYFAITAGVGNRQGLDAYVKQEGLNFKLMNDSLVPGPNFVPSLFGMVDIERTRVLTQEVYRYGGLFTVDTLRLDPTDDNIAGNLAFPLLALGDAYRQTGNLAEMQRAYERAQHLSPNPELQNLLAQLRAAEGFLPGLDSGADSAQSGDTTKR